MTATVARAVSGYDDREPSSARVEEGMRGMLLLGQGVVTKADCDFSDLTWRCEVIAGDGRHSCTLKMVGGDPDDVACQRQGPAPSRERPAARKPAVAR